MRRALLYGLVLGFAVAMAGTAVAEKDGGLPWQKDGDKGDESAEESNTGTTVDLKKEMSSYQYRRYIQPIVAQMDVAKKQLELYDKEMEKEEGKQSLAKALKYQEKAAEALTGASLRAKQAAKVVREDKFKKAITSQYEKPALKKAIALHLEIADTRLRHRDVRGAIAHYRQVLELDPDNEDAKAGLKKIQEAIAEARRKGGGGKVVGGGGDDDSPIGTEEKDWRKSDEVRDATGGRGL